MGAVVMADVVGQVGHRHAAAVGHHHRHKPGFGWHCHGVAHRDVVTQGVVDVHWEDFPTPLVASVSRSSAHVQISGPVENCDVTRVIAIVAKP